MRLLARRWRLRTLMVAVAVVAAALGAWLQGERRRSEYQRRAVAHQKEWFAYAQSGSGTFHPNATCREFREEGYPPTEDGSHWHSIGGLPKRAVREWTAYHSAMEGKYWAAARFPWLPAPADPPAPPNPPR